MEIENGPTPEFAVIIVFPSGLTVNPNGCGATVICFPVGLINRPFGITVVPSRLMLVYWPPAGAVAIQCASKVSVFLLQEASATPKAKMVTFKYFIGKNLNNDLHWCGDHAKGKTKSIRSKIYLLRSSLLCFNHRRCYLTNFSLTRVVQTKESCHRLSNLILIQLRFTFYLANRLRIGS